MSNQLPMFNALSGAYIASMYDEFRVRPESLTQEWRDYFTNLDGNGSNGGAATTILAAPSNQAEASLSSGARAAQRQDRVDQLIRAYRVRGHMIARFDPLGMPREQPPELDPAHFGLTDEDMDRQVSSRTMPGPDTRTLRDVIDRLRLTYCRSIGVQFMHIDDLAIRLWLQERMENSDNRTVLSKADQLRILSTLTKAVVFENSLQTKFVGAKTFSLEGSESLIPLLDLAIERAANKGVREIVIAMAHRGRLNVLVNIMGKRPADLFHEFEDHDAGADGASGDVKYHLGHSTDWETLEGHRVHLSLCFNPSHLEFVNPVALGRMRAKQDRAGDSQREIGMALLIHGDAAFAGQGVVQESLNLSELDGYHVGGALHIIVNNQIGFTTPPRQARSCTYATDVAKLLQIPIFHVNGEDPEAVAQVIHLAMDYRRQFKRDVVIDMYGYRRHGHNEIDEPSYTQPVLYRAIRERKPVREGYLDHLLSLGQVTREEADEIETAYKRELEEGLAMARSETYAPPSANATNIWSCYHGGPEETAEDVETGVPVDRLKILLGRTMVVPDGFHMHPRFQRVIHRREEMADGTAPLDWAAGEALAMATLATAGCRVRLTGQDVERGTFSHRHAVLHDFESGETYAPLQHLEEGQAPIDICNSPLSEAGVVGFEYGYSLDCPEGLVMWEAQFGDFVNAAQVIIDQFIVSGEDKRRRLSGVVLLLPHGFEGQGPEHSSAYIERFLTQAAEHNIQIAQPSTPAQIFHLLRRQVVRKWRKPLIVFTPKSLLRHPTAVSTLNELASGQFQRVIPDRVIKTENAKRVLLCAGKIYYDLLAARDESKRDDVAIVRLEQFYPLRIHEIQAVVERYHEGTPVVWVQEEPCNMGAWNYLRMQLGERLFGKYPFSGIHRAESASPATGSHATHKREQDELIRAALA